MPIFDNELPKSPIGGNDIKLPEPVLGSPSRPQVNTNLGGFGVPETGSTGLGLDQLADLANIPNKQNTFDSPFTAVPKSELLANQRYSMYQRNSDLENIYGLQQSWASQLGNSLVNMGVTAMGTFAQGFANIPNAIAAAQSGNVAKLSGDICIETAISSCWLLENKSFIKIGLFDETFFLYFADDDLCNRVKKIKKSVIQVYDSKCFHKHGVSKVRNIYKRIFLKEYNFVFDSLYYFHKHSNNQLFLDYYKNKIPKLFFKLFTKCIFFQLKDFIKTLSKIIAYYKFLNFIR